MTTIGTGDAAGRSAADQLVAWLRSRGGKSASELTR